MNITRHSANLSSANNESGMSRISEKLRGRSADSPHFKLSTDYPATDNYAPQLIPEAKIISDSAMISSLSSRDFPRRYYFLPVFLLCSTGKTVRKNSVLVVRQWGRLFIIDLRLGQYTNITVAKEVLSEESHEISFLQRIK